MKRALSVLVLSGLVIACNDREMPTAANTPSPFLEVRDGFSPSPLSPHFFFTFPIRRLNQPPPQSGFNPNLSPVVRICRWDTSTGSCAAGSPVFSLTMTSGASFRFDGLAVRLDGIVVFQNLKTYLALWNTKNLGLTLGQIYRIRVLVGTRELGFVDAKVVDLLHLLGVDRTQYLPLLRNSILPIPFWIGELALCNPTAPCTPGTVTTKTVNLDDPIPDLIALPTGDGIRIEQQSGLGVRTITVQGACAGDGRIDVAMPTFGRCLTITIDPVLGESRFNPLATVSVCDVGPLRDGLNLRQRELVAMHRQDGEAIFELAHSGDFCAAGLLPSPGGSARAGGLRGFAKTGWSLLRSGVAALIGPRRLYATSTLLDVGGGGETPFTSEFQFAFTAGEGAWEAAPGNLPPSAARRDHTATRLANGNVLIVGGTTSGAFLFDAATGTFSAIASANGPVFNHGQAATATLLADGRVLVVGGTFAPQSAEIFDPTAGTFTATAGMPSASRSYHTATRLPDGRVLVVGGQFDVEGGLETEASAELYDPGTNTFTATGSLNVSRSTHAALLLPPPDNRVIILGGRRLPVGTVLNSAEVYNIGTSAFTVLPAAMTAARQGLDAVLLPSGPVLIVGGAGVVDTSAELFNPTSNTFAATGFMLSPHGSGTATLLADGRVLVIGGFIAVGPVTTNAAEIYNPTLGFFTPAGPLIGARQEHTATLLLDGRVLAVGGVSGPTTNLSSAELFSLVPPPPPIP